MDKYKKCVYFSQRARTIETIMMKITVLVFLVSCAVCGVQANEGLQTPDCDSALAITVGGLMEKVTNLMEKMTQMEKEVTDLKSLTQGSPKVAFSASLYQTGSGNTGPFNVDTPLKYKNIFSNIGNNYNPDTGIFTATVKGLYYFRFSMHNTHRANSAVSLMKNSVKVVTVWDLDTADTHDIGSNAAVLPLEVGDNVYVNLQATRMVYDDTQNYNTFTGFLLFTN